MKQVQCAHVTNLTQGAYVTSQIQASNHDTLHLSYTYQPTILNFEENRLIFFSFLFHTIK